MESPPPVWAAPVPDSSVRPASPWPAPSVLLDDARPTSAPPPVSFRPRAHTPAGSVRIVPLWLSCSPKPRLLPGLPAQNKIYGFWFTGGAKSEHRKGPIQISEITSAPFMAAATWITPEPDSADSCCASPARSTPLPAVPTPHSPAPCHPAVAHCGYSSKGEGCARGGNGSI